MSETVVDQHEAVVECIDILLMDFGGMSIGQDIRKMAVEKLKCIFNVQENSMAYVGIDWLIGVMKTLRAGDYQSRKGVRP